MEIKPKLNLSTTNALDFSSITDKDIIFAFLNLKYDYPWKKEIWCISNELCKELASRFSVDYDSNLLKEIERLLNFKIGVDESLSGLEIKMK